MKILFVTQNFYPELGSAANRIGAIFKLLKKNNYDAYVLTTNPTYPYENLFENNDYYNDYQLNELEKSKIYRIDTKIKKQGKFFKRILYFIEEFFRVRLFFSMHKNKYDYIYVTSPNIFMAWSTLFFKKKNTKYVLEIRDLWPDSANQIKGLNISVIMPILKFLESRMYNSADKIIINNLYFENHIQQRLKKEVPILYLPNAIQITEKIDIIKNNEFSVIYTGNIGHAQDVNQLIEVAKKLNENKIQFNVIIYGVHSSKFKSEVNHLEYIHVKDPLPRKECLQEISKAHVALSLLKNSEIFMNVLPGKIIDSISMGTIPITNLTGFTKRIIKNNKLGIAEKNITVENIMENIMELKNNYELRNKMIINAINYRNQNLIWEDNIKKLDELLLKDETFEQRL